MFFFVIICWTKNLGVVSKLKFNIKHLSHGIARFFCTCTCIEFIRNYRIHTYCMEFIDSYLQRGCFMKFIGVLFIQLDFFF